MKCFVTKEDRFLHAVKLELCEVVGQFERLTHLELVTGSLDVSGVRLSTLIHAAALARWEAPPRDFRNRFNGFGVAEWLRLENR